MRRCAVSFDLGVALCAVIAGASASVSIIERAHDVPVEVTRWWELWREPPWDWVVLTIDG